MDSKAGSIIRPAIAQALEVSANRAEFYQLLLDMDDELTGAIAELEVGMEREGTDDGA